MLQNHHRASTEPTVVIDEFLLDYASGPKSTLANYVLHLKKSLLPFLETQGVADLAAVDSPLLRRWLMAELSRSYQRGHSPARQVSAKYIAQRRLAAHRLWEWCIEQGYLEDNPVSRVKPPKLPKPTRVGLTQEEARRLVNESGRGWGWLGKRDRAIVTLMFGCGLRAIELLGLSMEDVDFPRHRIRVRRGKGDKGRWVPLGDKARRALTDYIRVRPQNRLHGLWLTIRGTEMSYQTLYKMLEHVGHYAGIEDVTPHRLRHTYAAEWYPKNQDIIALRNLLGHSKIQTTEQYLRSLGMDYGTGSEYATPDAWLG